MLKSNLRGKAFYITMGMNHRVNVIYYVSYYLSKKKKNVIYYVAVLLVYITSVQKTEKCILIMYLSTIYPFIKKL